MGIRVTNYSRAVRLMPEVEEMADGLRLSGQLLATFDKYATFLNHG